MKSVRAIAVLLGVMAVAGAAQAKGITKQQMEMCRWGSDVASQAQQAKLGGRTLYSTRKKVQARKYPQPWMPKMAVGITEQTFRSDSLIKPAAVKKAYYDGCVKHQVAHR